MKQIHYDMGNSFYANSLMLWSLFVFISESQLVARRGGGIMIEEKKVCFQMLFRHFKVFLVKVFFFLLEILA